MSNHDKDYLSCTLVGEVRGEPIEGIVAVAFVIRNRAYTGNKLYKDVCLEPKQFSCWNDGDPNQTMIRIILNDLDTGNPITDPYIRQCVAVASAVYNGDFICNVDSCRNYVTLKRLAIASARRDPKLDGWITKMKEYSRIGNHVFLV